MAVAPQLDQPEPSPLATARLQRKLTIEEAAHRAGLSPEQLQWLEEGRVYRFPSADDALVAAVERKTLEDFVKALVDGSLGFRLADLAALPAAAVVVEERYGALLKVERVQPGWLLELVARLQVRYPSVPIVFADSRKLAEEWTYRFLAAALAEHAASEDQTHPPARSA